MRISPNYYEILGCNQQSTEKEVINYFEISIHNVFRLYLILT